MRGKCSERVVTVWKVWMAEVELRRVLYRSMASTSLEIISWGISNVILVLLWLLVCRHIGVLGEVAGIMAGEGASTVAEEEASKLVGEVGHTLPREESIQDTVTVKLDCSQVHKPIFFYDQ